MTYTSWNPFRELETLRRELERAFDVFGLERARWPFSRTAFLPGISARAYPLVNMSEDKDNLYVEALAPGLDATSLELTVIRDTLRIAGEKEALSPEIKPEAFHRSERSAGKFARNITLPVEVNAEAVTAQYKNGLLLVTLPKSEAAKPKQITVNVG